MALVGSAQVPRANLEEWGRTLSSWPIFVILCTNCRRQSVLQIHLIKPLITTISYQINGPKTYTNTKKFME